MTRVRQRLLVFGLLTALGASAFGAAAPKPAAKAPAAEPECQDVKIGRENAAILDKQLKLVTDPAILERVNRIGQEIAAVANTDIIPVNYGLKQHEVFTYTFKVVEDKEVNAFSLPGGFVYVNTGLLNFVHSDDELAGVLAHEITHVAHRHMMLLIKQAQNEQYKALGVALAAGLAGAATGGGANLPALFAAVQLYTAARVNSWTIEAEKDADAGAVRYLMKTRFNPVGILTFMERLAQQETLSPNQEQGYLRTHPPSAERSQALLALLTDLKIPIDRRDVDPSLRAVVQAVTVNGAKLAEVKLGDVVVARVTGAGAQTADVRAQALATGINTLFDDGLQTYEVRLADSDSSIVARGRNLVTFTDADAQAQNTTVAQLAQSARSAIQTLLWQDQTRRQLASSGGG